MLRISLLSGLVGLLIVVTPSTDAQRLSLAPDLDIQFNGGVQPRVSLGIDDPGGDDETRYGPGIRRARIQARVLYRELAGVEYDVEGASGVVQSVDMFAFANVAENVQVRVGYFPIAQPRGGVMTPYFNIDAVDRAAIAERWMAGTLGGDGRDLGADVSYSAGNATATLALHNGAGTFDGSTANYRQGISGSTVIGGPETTGFAVSAAASYTLASGVEVGAFGSINGANSERSARDGDGRDYTTGGAHIYWGAEPGSQPVRLKLDALALRYGDDGQGAQEAAGVSALGALRVLGSGEAFVRVERFWTDIDAAGDTYATAGLSYSPSAAIGDPYQRARLTLAYQYRDGAMLPDAHLVILQGQLVF